jgi:hypothetical protein
MSNLFFDPTADTTPAVKHRNILHIVFIVLASLGCGILGLLIFASLFRLAPFDRTHSIATGGGDGAEDDEITINYDSYFNNSTGQGIPFITVSAPPGPPGPPNTYCTFIRVGVQIFEQLTASPTDLNPVSSVWWSRYRSFENNVSTGSTITVNHAIPYIFMVNSDKTYIARYYKEIAESRGVAPPGGICEAVKVSDVNSIVEAKTLLTPVPGDVLIATLDRNRPIKTFTFVV